MRRSLGVVAALSVLFAARVAAAQAQPDEATRLAARMLGEAGLALVQGGDYAGALQKFERAMALVPVPTLGVRTARCLVKLGRLVEASAQYKRVAAMPIDDRMPEAFRAAQAEAKEQAATEGAAIEPRVSRVEVVFEGALPGDVALEVDGKPPAPIPPGALLLDPGTHRLVARRGTDEASQEVTLQEGQAARVVLKLPPRASAPFAPPLAAAPPPLAPAAGDAGSGSAMRVGAFVTLGVGGAALVAGGITYAAAASKTGQLDKLCPAGNCHTDAKSQLDSYNTLRTASSIMLVGGAVVATAGVVVFLAAPSRRDRRAAIAPWFGGDQGGVAGTF